jgi:hypothetical protein
VGGGYFCRHESSFLEQNNFFRRYRGLLVAGRLVVGIHNDRFSEKVNLALRRTGHYLLVEAGDSSTRIAPVRQTDAVTWQIRLDHSFDYNRLPALLQKSMELQGIRDNYDVEVFKCSDGVLQLGYNFLDFKENSTAPCMGREMESGCYNLQVRFVAPTNTAGNPMLAWFAAAGCLLLTGIFLTVRHRRKPEIQDAPAAERAHLVLFGNSRLDTGNQTLVSGAARHTLTYREAKLLHLFGTHPNQLLERDFILQSVWGDEGILVGRSVDVFVSRLRKLLRDDPSVKIAAVHGMGYRLVC